MSTQKMRIMVGIISMFILQMSFIAVESAPKGFTDHDRAFKELFSREDKSSDKFKQLAGNFLNGPVHVPKFVKGSQAPDSSDQPTEKREIEKLWNKAKELPESDGSIADRFEKLLKLRQDELKRDKSIFDYLKKRIVDSSSEETKSEKVAPAGEVETEQVESKRMVETLSKRLAADFDKYFKQEMAKANEKRVAPNGGTFVAVGKREDKPKQEKKEQAPLVYMGRKDPNGNNEGEVDSKVDEKSNLDALRALVAKYEGYLHKKHPSKKTDKYSEELDGSSKNSVEHEEFEVPYAKHGKGGFLDKTIEDISKRLKKLEKGAGIESPQKVSTETEQILSGFGDGKK